MVQLAREELGRPGPETLLRPPAPVLTAQAEAQGGGAQPPGRSEWGQSQKGSQAGEATKDRARRDTEALPRGLVQSRTLPRRKASVLLAIYPSF